VDYVHVSDENMTFDGQPAVAVNQSSTTAQLVYREDEPGLLRCVALGGSPPPDIDLYVNQHDLTSTLTLSRSPSLSRERGLRLVYYTTELSTDRLQLTADDDGALLQCVVTVAGLPANVTTAHVTVQCTLSPTSLYAFTASLFLSAVFLLGYMCLNEKDKL